MAEMILVFNTDGTVDKKTKGFTGKSCVEQTKFIEEALGESKNRRFNQEYYDEATESERSKLRA
jgi:hypothetical protein